MDFDPTAARRERKRSGPRWHSRVAFFVIALLLLFNAIAMFANAEANEEQACYIRADVIATNWGVGNDVTLGAQMDCDEKYERGHIYGSDG
jgi:hypothetical protein